MSRAIDHNETYDNAETPDPQSGPGRIDDPGSGRPDPVPVYLQHAFFYDEETSRFKPHQHVLVNVAEDAESIYNSLKTKVNRKAALTKGLNQAMDAPDTTWAKNSIVYAMAALAAMELCSQYYRITDFERGRHFAVRQDNESRISQLDSMIEEAESSLHDAVRLALWVEDQDVTLDFQRGANDAMYREAGRQTKLHRPQPQQVSGRERTSVVDRLAAGH